MYSKILVPHDGSDASNRALDVAVRIAEKDYSEIILFNVIEEILFPPLIRDIKFKSKITLDIVSKEVFLKEIYQELRNDKTMSLEILKKKYKNKNINIKIEVKVEGIGHPSESILKRLQNDDIGLIVMGTNSLKGIKKIAALGSVARKVSELTECNVLLIH